MFCPLCGSQFVHNVEVCTDCGMALVADDAPLELRRPAQRRFVLKSREGFERVRDALSAQRIPHRGLIEHDHWVQKLLGMQVRFEIHVLASDEGHVRRVLSGLGPALEPPPKPLEERSQISCPFCKELFPSDYYLSCPACGLDLEPGRTAGPQVPGTSPADPPEVVWRGSDPVAFSQAISILRDADIAEIPAQTSQHMVFGLAVARPMLEIRTYRSDADQARELLAGCVGTGPLNVSEAEFADAVENSEARADSPPGVSGEASVWSGEAAEIAHNMRHGLHEIGIPTRTPVDSPKETIFVPLERLAEARNVCEAILGSASPVIGEGQPSDYLIRRKRFLQIGAALCLLGSWLFPWASRESLPSLEFALRFESLRAAAFHLLFYVGLMSRGLSFLFLLFSWSLRFDKIGRLSLLFFAWNMFGVTATIALFFSR